MIINGVKVLSPSFLEENSNRNASVVIAIEDNSVALSVADCIKNQGFSSVLFFNKYIKLDLFSPFIYIPRGNDLSRIFTPACLRYIQHILDKDVYILSNDIVFLKNVVKTLRCLGIFLNKAISTTIEANIYEDDFMIFNANELINHNHNYIIWSLPDDYDLGKSFLKISGLPTECFLYSTNAPCRLDRTYVLDTNLGFADERLYIKLDNQVNSETPVSVAILGDSTSDYDLLYEKTWVEFLMNIATENNIHLRCIVAATSGNTSAQEIIRLTRDLIWEKPDIVISYGRVTEIPLTIDQHEFTHFYQDQIFSTLQNSQNGISFFGTSASKSISRGRVNKSLPEVWFNNQRIMHGICYEFGIRFLAFLPPSLFTKFPESYKDRELKESLCNIPKERIKKEQEFVDKIKEIINTNTKQYEWLIDFTSIFDSYGDDVYIDECHLTGNKNKILAQKIYYHIFR